MKFFQIKIDISLFLYYKYVYLEYHNSSVENIEAKIDYSIILFSLNSMNRHFFHRKRLQLY